jgi:hypothetical protein
MLDTDSVLRTAFRRHDLQLAGIIALMTAVFSGFSRSFLSAGNLV